MYYGKKEGEESLESFFAWNLILNQKVLARDKMGYGRRTIRQRGNHYFSKAKQKGATW